MHILICIICECATQGSGHIWFTLVREVKKKKKKKKNQKKFQEAKSENKVFMWHSPLFVLHKHISNIPAPQA